MCEKWRIVPPRISDAELPDKWTCQQKHWDPANANCNAPQETDAEELEGDQANESGEWGYSSAIQSQTQPPCSVEIKPWPGLPSDFIKTADGQRFYTLLTHLSFPGEINDPFPTIDNRPLNLMTMYALISRYFQSFEQVPPSQWSQIALAVNVPPTEPVLNYLREVYRRYVLPVETYVRAHAFLPQSDPQPQPATPREKREEKRSKYNNNLPRRKVPWTADEDAALTAGLRQYGVGKWTAIVESEEFGPRLCNHTAPECRNRWRALQREEDERRNRQGAPMSAIHQLAPQAYAQQTVSNLVQHVFSNRVFPITAVKMDTHNKYEEEFRLSEESDSFSESETDDSRRRTRSKKKRQKKIKRRREVHDSDEDLDLHQLAHSYDGSYQFYNQNKSADLWLSGELAIPIRHLKSYLHNTIQPSAAKILPLLKQTYDLHCLNDRRDTLSSQIYDWLLEDETMCNRLLDQMNEYTIQTQRTERRRNYQLQLAVHMQNQHSYSPPDLHTYQTTQSSLPHRQSIVHPSLAALQLQSTPIVVRQPMRYTPQSQPPQENYADHTNQDVASIRLRRLSQNNYEIVKVAYSDASQSDASGTKAKRTKILRLKRIAPDQYILIDNKDRRQLNKPRPSMAETSVKKDESMKQENGIAAQTAISQILDSLQHI